MNHETGIVNHGGSRNVVFRCFHKPIYELMNDNGLLGKCIKLSLFKKTDIFRHKQLTLHFSGRPESQGIKLRFFLV